MIRTICLRALFLFFCFSFTCTLNAQNSTEKQIDDYIELAKKNHRNADSGRYYGTRILEIAKPTNNLKGLLRGYFYLGYSKNMEGDLQQSTVYYDSALTYKKQGLDKEYDIVITILRNKAINYARNSNFSVSDALFEDIINITKDHKDGINLARSYSDLGIGRVDRNQYEEGIALYKRAMKVYDSMGNDAQKASLFINIGVAQGRLKNRDQSNESFREAFNIAKNNNNERDEYRAYNNLSVNFMEQEKYDSSLYYLRKIVPYYKNNNHKYPEFLAYQNLGKTFMNQGTKDSATFYFKKALRGYKSIKNETGVASVYNLLGSHYYREENYDKAITYLDSSITVAVKLDKQMILRNNYTLISTVYEGKGDFENAHRYLEAAHELELNSFTAENVKNLNELLTKYQSEKKDEQISILSDTNVFYKSTSSIILLIAIVLLVLFVIFWKRHKTQQTELFELREELQNFKEEKKQAPSPSNLLHLKSKAVVKIEDLMYVKSDGHYLEFYSEDSNTPEVDRNTLRDMKEKLQQEGFAQIHKSYLVNLEYIRIINSTKIMLQNGTWLPLSRTYKADVKKTLIQNQEQKD